MSIDMSGRGCAERRLAVSPVFSKNRLSHWLGRSQEPFMSCRSGVLVGVLFSASMGVLTSGATGRAAEDPRTAQRFLQELRDRGFHDQALYFIDLLRADPS